jgi:hypothetical protein
MIVAGRLLAKVNRTKIEKKSSQSRDSQARHSLCLLQNVNAPQKFSTVLLKSLWKRGRSIPNGPRLQRLTPDCTNLVQQLRQEIHSVDSTVLAVSYQEKTSVSEIISLLQEIIRSPTSTSAAEAPA